LKQCPACHETYPDTATYCDKEGAKLIDIAGPPVPSQALTMGGPNQAPSPPAAAPVIKCNNCGWSGPTPYDDYCPECGAKLEATPVPVPVQAPQVGPTLELVFTDSTKLELATFPSKLGREDFKRYPGSQFVSRAHLTIYFENGQFQVEDTNSLNGTSLNGNVIGKGRNGGGGTGRQPLKDGDTLSLAGPFDEKGQGAVSFRVRVVQPAGKPTA